MPPDTASLPAPPDARAGPGAGTAFPKTVTIVSLGATCDPVALREELVALADGPVVRSSLGNAGVTGAPVTAVYKKQRHRITYLIAPRELVGTLDAAKVADLLLFLLPMHRGPGARRRPRAKGAPTANPAPRALRPTPQTSASTTLATLR